MQLLLVKYFFYGDRNNVSSIKSNNKLRYQIIQEFQMLTPMSFITHVAQLHSFYV